MGAKYRAVLRDYAFQSLEVPIRITGSDKSTLLKDIQKNLKEHEVIRTVSEDSEDVSLVVSERDSKIWIEGTREMPLQSSVSLDESEPAQRILDQLDAWVYWFNVRSLKPETSVLDVDVVLQSNLKEGALIELMDGDRFTVSIHNKNEWDVFVNLVNLASDGSIDVFWPLYSQAQLVKANSTHKTLPFPIQVLRGERDIDLIKVVVATNPVNLKMLSQGAIRGGMFPSPSQLEKLLESSFLDTQRDISSPIGDWTTREVVIQSTKK